jgi:hypothetical protein
MYSTYCESGLEGIGIGAPLLDGVVVGFGVETFFRGKPKAYKLFDKKINSKKKEMHFRENRFILKLLTFSRPF